MRKKQTSKANQARTDKANAYALLVVDELNRIEGLAGYRFKSLSDRKLALYSVGFKTVRGRKWSKTQISRVLKRANDLS